jgi:hypothetical protein
MPSNSVKRRNWGNAGNFGHETRRDAALFFSRPDDVLDP